MFDIKAESLMLTKSFLSKAIDAYNNIPKDFSKEKGESGIY